jgi:nucleoside-diphosphate-sugar epimerase
MQKIAVTGANGFLGQGMAEILARDFSLRLCDIGPFANGPHEVMAGDVADLSFCRKLVQGVEAIVVAHMLSRTHDKTAYREPPRPFNANVTGTANLFFAAAEAGIKRAVLISSVSAVAGHGKLPFYPHDLPPLPGDDIYSLTKTCQEIIAWQAHHTHHMQVAALRIGGIADADTNTGKYGNKYPGFGLELIDRRDIGEAVRLSLLLPDLAYETFIVMGPPEAAAVYDTAYTKKRLGWRPKYEFGDMK